MSPLTKMKMMAAAFSLLAGALLLLAGGAQAYAAAGDPDPTFNPGTGINGTYASVTTMAVQPDGKILIGGYFTAYNGATRRGVARLNPDGSLDASFNSGLKADYAPPRVRKIVLLPDGKIIIGGLFLAYHTNDYDYVARLNPDGSLDNTFNPAPIPRVQVDAMALLPDGKIIIGGSGLTRLNANGSIDTSYVSVEYASPGGITTMSAQPDGKVILGGYFRGLIYPGPVNYNLHGIARVNADGSLDTTFNPGTGAEGTGIEGWGLRTTLLQPDGKIIIGGDFLTYNGVQRINLARVNANGSLDTTFNQGVSMSGGTVFTATLQPDGKIIIAGDFTAYNGVPRNRVARLNPDGSLDATFRSGAGANSRVYEAVRQTDGRILIGGEFTNYDGGLRNGVARLLPELVASSHGKYTFASASYTVSEGAGRVNITVNRTGSEDPATVDYATPDLGLYYQCSGTNGFASANCDYATSIGTLRFSAGETSKVITIPIVEDSYTDGAESFTVTLKNPLGAGLEEYPVTTVNITDNDSATGANPVDTNAFFVRQLYIDLLGREPEPAGFNAWLNILNNCQTPAECDRLAVAAGFAASPEFRDRGYFIYRLYAAGLGRLPYYYDIMPDMARVSGFLSGQDLEANKQAFVTEFMSRSDFTGKYGSLSDAAFVDALLASAGLPAHTGRSGWLSGLTNSTLTRAQVFRQLIESPEVYNKFLSEATVVMNYFGFLRRNPDAAYQSWINTLNQTGDYRLLINGFINSPEYRRRFGP